MRYLTIFVAEAGFVYIFFERARRQSGVTILTFDVGGSERYQGVGAVSLSINCFPSIYQRKLYKFHFANNSN